MFSLSFLFIAYFHFLQWDSWLWQFWWFRQISCFARVKRQKLSHSILFFPPRITPLERLGDSFPYQVWQRSLQYNLSSTSSHLHKEWRVPRTVIEEYSPWPPWSTAKGRRFSFFFWVLIASCQSSYYYSGKHWNSELKSYN